MTFLPTAWASETSAVSWLMSSRSPAQVRNELRRPWGTKCRSRALVSSDNLPELMKVPPRLGGKTVPWEWWPFCSAWIRISTACLGNGTMWSLCAFIRSAGKHKGILPHHWLHRASCIYYLPGLYAQYHQVDQPNCGGVIARLGRIYENVTLRSF